VDQYPAGAVTTSLRIPLLCRVERLVMKRASNQGTPAVSLV
jgi:hypothetical protein